MIDCFAFVFTQLVLKLSETTVRSEIALKTPVFCRCWPDHTDRSVFKDFREPLKLYKELPRKRSHRLC